MISTHHNIKQTKIHEDHNQLTIKTFMAITAQRDAAIQEKNVALEERKRAFAERDMAMLQRDAAIAERDSAIRERNEAIAAMQTRECSVNNMLPDSAVEEVADGAQDMHYQQQMRYAMTDAAFSPKEISTTDTLNAAEVASETANSGEVGQPKEGEITKSVRSPRMSKRQAESMVKPITPASSNVCNIGHDLENEEDPERQPVTWKDNSGLNQINFDESSMPVPVCTCTGTPQPCYKWGSGGWQSACCTTTMSQYPLPQVSNKRTRVGGRKMSGSAFGKLLNRLAAEGHDLHAAPIDLKDHWAKHGTNRYSTLK